MAITAQKSMHVKHNENDFKDILRQQYKDHTINDDRPQTQDLTNLTNTLPKSESIVE